jgi:hypothetical protein
MDSSLVPGAFNGETDNAASAEVNADKKPQQVEFDQFWQELLQEEQDADHVAANPVSATTEAEEQLEPVDPQAILNQQVEQVRRTVLINPRFSEIHYHILEFCQEQQLLRDIEAMIATLPQFLSSDQTQYRLISFLETAEGLQRIELDENLNTVTADIKEGLSEDEIDDLVCDYAFITTEAGRVIVQEMQPEKRMKNLMELFPQRAQTYCEVLEYCQEPRSWKDIDKLLEGREVLKSGSLNTMTNNPLKPTVFIDRLESSGGLIWEKGEGWKITADGRRFLELTQNKQV